MRQPVIFILVALLFVCVGVDAEAHEGVHGTTASMEEPLAQTDVVGEEGSTEPCGNVDCCFACLLPGLPGSASSALSFDFLTASARSQFDEILTDGLSHAPPSRPPISA